MILNSQRLQAFFVDDRPKKMFLAGLPVNLSKLGKDQSIENSIGSDPELLQKNTRWKPFLNNSAFLFFCYFWLSLNVNRLSLSYFISFVVVVQASVHIVVKLVVLLSNLSLEGVFNI